MDQDESRPSPGLNMEHGFLKKIEQNQILREKQAREDVNKRNDSVKMARKVGFQIRSSKPAMEIYRPPSLRVSGDFSALAGAGLPIHPEAVDAIPWIPVPSTAMATASQYTVQPIGLSKSRSTTSAHRVHFQLQPPTSGIETPSPTNATSTGHAKKEPSYGLKRSKSLGANDMRLFVQELDISSFNAETQVAIKRALDDPNKVPARQLMEIVRHLFNKVLESCRYAEPTARLCIAIIEKERNETFLESLLNSCREWYNERDRLFEDGGGGGGGRPASQSRHPPMKPSRWVAYVTFLYELYTRLKTKKQTPMIATNTTPAAVILTLLSECCLLFLKPSSLMGHSEIECLFIVLTSIGRDLQSEFPLRMQVLINAIRDAFLAPTTPQPVRKTLLQLIELNASKWQLKAEAVTYYYPGNQRE